jgi:hypothetical protein
MEGYYVMGCVKSRNLGTRRIEGDVVRFREKKIRVILANETCVVAFLQTGGGHDGAILENVGIRAKQEVCISKKNGTLLYNAG